MHLQVYFAAVIGLGVALWFHEQSVYRDLPLAEQQAAALALLPIGAMAVELIVVMDAGVDVDVPANEAFQTAAAGLPLRLVVRTTTSPHGIPTSNGRYVLSIVASASTAESLVLDNGQRMAVYTTGAAGDNRLSSIAARVGPALLSVFVDEAETGVPTARPLKYHKGVHLSFGLLCGGHACSWASSVRQAVAQFVEPLVQDIALLGPFSVSTEVQYFAPMAVASKPTADGQARAIEHSRLANFVNQREWTLASAADDLPPVHYVIYVPQPQEQPLYLLDDGGQPLPNNAFAVPGWGGVVVHNSNNNSDLDMDTLRGSLAVFVTQLRQLLDIAPLTARPHSVAGMTTAGAGKGVSVWERDRAVRLRTRHDIAQTMDTLHSLHSMLEKITNIVVEDHVGRKWRAALAGVVAANSLYGKGHYDDACTEAAAAVAAAEEAFFDPTMVAQVYFPEEHKYAIYTPLFLPTIVPVVVSLVTALSRLRRT